MYCNRIEELGLDLEGRIHSTHFKDCLLLSCPNLVAYKSSRDVFVSFREDIGAILQNAYAEDADDEGTYLAKAANIVRREILNCSARFEGTFDESSQKVFVPKTNHENVYKQQPCLSIFQLLVYNTYKQHRQLDEQTFSRHSKDREPSLPVYIGLLIHSQTRQSNLVSNLHDLGMEIVDCVLEIENEAAYAMCKQYKTEGVLCPPNLQKSLFTTSAYDNIDHITQAPPQQKNLFMELVYLYFNILIAITLVTTGRRHLSATHCQNRRLIYQLSIHHCFLLVF